VLAEQFKSDERRSGPDVVKGEFERLVDGRHHHTAKAMAAITTRLVRYYRGVSLPLSSDASRSAQSFL
jgi:hypothetical protein